MSRKSRKMSPRRAARNEEMDDVILGVEDMYDHESFVV